MRRTAHHPVLAVALVAVLALSTSCSSDDSGSESEPTPSTSASPSTSTSTSTSTSASTSASASASADATGPNEVATLLGRNLEAFKKATGSYPQGGSPDYRTVVDIDQADGYTIAYSVDGAGRMILCVSGGGSSAGYDSKDRTVTDGGAQGCGA